VPSTTEPLALGPYSDASLICLDLLSSQGYPVKRDGNTNGWSMPSGPGDLCPLGRVICALGRVS